MAAAVKQDNVMIIIMVMMMTSKAIFYSLALSIGWSINTQFLSNPNTECLIKYVIIVLKNAQLYGASDDMVH